MVETPRALVYNLEIKQDGKKEVPKVMPRPKAKPRPKNGLEILADGDVNFLNLTVGYDGNNINSKVFGLRNYFGKHGFIVDATQLDENVYSLVCRRNQEGDYMEVAA